MECNVLKFSKIFEGSLGSSPERVWNPIDFDCSEDVVVNMVGWTIS